MVVAHYAGDDKNKLRSALARVWAPLVGVPADQLSEWAHIYKNSYLRGDDYVPDLTAWDAIKGLGAR